MDFDEIVKEFKKILNQKNLESKIMSYLLDPSNTNIDRLSYITQYLTNFNLLPIVAKPCKTNGVSKLYQNEANIEFCLDKYLSACIQCTKSSAYAEMDICTEYLATAYAARSAVLFRMKFYEECIQDIERALKLDYPTEKRELLLSRKRAAQIKQQETKISNFYDQMPIDFIDNITTYPKVQLNSNTRQERYLVATRDIEPGELISIEEPYITNVTIKNFYSHCCHCTRYILNPIPCDQCTFAVFCNENCKQQAQDYHQFECPLMLTLSDLNSNEFFSILRILIISMKDDLQNVMKLMQNEDEAIYKFGTVTDMEDGVLDLCSNYAAIHYFNSNIEKRHLVLSHYIGASILLHALKQVDFFTSLQKFLRSLKLKTIIKLTVEMLLHHLHSHVWYINDMYSLVNNFSDTIQLRITSQGAYPFYGSLQHSCDPNVLPIFHGKRLILRASQPIKKGDQLYRYFRVRYEETDRDMRQQLLSMNLLYDCKCRPCTENWPTLTEMKENRNIPSEIRHLIWLTHNVYRINEPLDQRKSFRLYLPQFRKYLKQLECRKPCFEYSMLQKGIEILCRIEGNIIFQYPLETIE